MTRGLVSLRSARYAITPRAGKLRWVGRRLSPNKYTASHNFPVPLAGPSIPATTFRAYAPVSVSAAIVVSYTPLSISFARAATSHPACATPLSRYRLLEKILRSVFRRRFPILLLLLPFSLSLFFSLPPFLSPLFFEASLRRLFFTSARSWHSLGGARSSGKVGAWSAQRALQDRLRSVKR